MVRSSDWQEALRRYQWNDRYLAGEPFAAFVASEEARVQSILDRLGVSATESASPAVGPYPIVVAVGLLVTATLFAANAIAQRRRAPVDAPAAIPAMQGQAAHLRAAVLIAAALVANVVLMEHAGFVLASMPLFWLTARAFDDRHPWRDVAIAAALSLGAYLLFARLLHIELPAGVLSHVI